MMSRWPSPAKLNLFLYITGQRADGYHTLQTLFQFLDYGDTLTIEPRADGELRLSMLAYRRYLRTWRQSSCSEILSEYPWRLQE